MPDKEDLQIRLEDWIQSVRQGVVKDLFDIFSSHKAYCQKEALLAIRQNDMVKASRWEAKSEDMDSLEKAVRSRIDVLKKEQRNG